MYASVPRNLVKPPIQNAKSMLDLVLMNTRSVRKKSTLIVDYLQEHNIDVAAITET